MSGGWYISLYINRCLGEADKFVIVLTMGLEEDCSLSEMQTHPFTSVMARALSDLTYCSANIFP